MLSASGFARITDDLFWAVIATPPSAFPVLLRACWLVVRGPGDWGSLVEFARLSPV